MRKQAKWVRLDASRLRDARSRYAKAERFYASGGRKYPRLSIGIWAGHVNEPEDAGVLSIAASRKNRAGEHWYSCGLPVELLGELREMLAEFERMVEPKP